MTTRTELLEGLPEGRILCAVSGGLDSMCLLHLLAVRREEGRERIVAAHFNHQLRGEAADRDEAFVRQTCEKWGVPLTVGRGNVRDFAKREGLSVEEAARTLRYAFLRQAAEAEGCCLICTAHHADDNAETVLLNLIRGTGVKGLAGIERRREGIVCRPLLDMTRKELEDYAERWNVPHVEDETNADPEAAGRNFLRLRVMPLLKELNPRAVEHMSRTAGQLRAIDCFLEEDAARRTAHVELQEGRVSLSGSALLDAPEPVRGPMLLRLFDLLGVGRKDIGAVHLNAVLAMLPLAQARGESCLSLPHGVTARYREGRLSLETRLQPLAEARLLPGGPLVWGDYVLTLLDHREGGGGIALRLPTEGESGALTVAPPPPGGRLTLPGARGSRSVKRLCLDRRVPLEERDRLPAIYAEGRLAAVWRLGVDTEFAPEGKGPCRFIKIKRHTEEDKNNAQRNGE